MPKKNTIQAQDGAEIYQHKILELADEYLESLDSPEDIYNPGTSCFNGMIKHISRHLFKKHKLDYSDIETLDDIWDIYASLCYKYNRCPTIMEFCLLVNIARDTLWQWRTERTRAYKYYTTDGMEIKDFPAWRINHQDEEYVKKPSTSHSDAVKKWSSECESILYRGAVEGNKIGCIFALKANYGYRETAPAPPETASPKALEDEQIPQIGSIGNV